MASILDTIDRPQRVSQLHPRPRMAPADRIARNSRLDAATGCIEWTGRLSRLGYGQMTVTQAGYLTVSLLAHRAAWELANGRIPEGLVIDHLCRNRACVNIQHLEPVTQRVNLQRSPLVVGAVNRRKTHCKRGHELTSENVYRQAPAYARRCRACTLAAAKAKRAAKREAVSA